MRLKILMQTGKKQALGKAVSYLESSAFSKERLYDQLIYEKFTENEARYGVNNIKANWNDQAVKKSTELS